MNYTEVEFPKPVGFLMRLCALIIDFYIVTSFFQLVCLVLFFTLLFIAKFLPETQADILVSVLKDIAADIDGKPLSEEQKDGLNKIYFFIYPAYILFSIFYHSILESTSLRGSVGKAVLKIVVVRSDGSPTNFFISFTRNLMAWVLGICTLTIGYWFAGFTKSKRALHDMVTGCVVVKKF